MTSHAKSPQSHISPSALNTKKSDCCKLIPLLESNHYDVVHILSSNSKNYTTIIKAVLFGKNWAILSLGKKNSERCINIWAESRLVANFQTVLSAVRTGPCHP